MSAVCRRVRRKSRPVERDVFEPHDRAARPLLRGQPFLFRLNPGQRHASLDAALHVDELDLHVDGDAELGVIDLELFELGYLARFSAGGTGRTFVHGVGL